MPTTDQKGAIAELAIAREALERGLEVYRPMAEGGRYDLILGVGSRLLRVQCKYVRLCGDTVRVRCYSSRRSRDGLRKRRYTAAEVDVIAAYCPELDRCFLLASEHFDNRTQFDLRVAASRNNQRQGVNWAADYDFEARLGTLLGP